MIYMMFFGTDLPQNISVLYIGVYDLRWIFPSYPDGLGYPTFQLTDILGYSSKLNWLSVYVYDILNCCALGFHSL